MLDFEVARLLENETVAVGDVRCRGTGPQCSAHRCVNQTHLAFPYRGVTLRHVGGEPLVADANHVQFFNAGEVHCVGHPIAGGHSSLVLAVSQPLLRELVPVALVASGAEFAFAVHALRIDARAQALVALLGHSLRGGTIETLEAESLALTLVCRSIGPRTAVATRSTLSRRRLVDRVKVLLAGDLNRRWSLAEIAAEIGGSAVYLTQAFQQVEGLPLYRYHLRLRLARALDLVARCEDMSALALDLGFSSHSHFAAAFRQAYGRSPTAFRQAALTRSA